MRIFEIASLQIFLVFGGHGRCFAFWPNRHAELEAGRHSGVGDGRKGRNGTLMRVVSVVSSVLVVDQFCFGQVGTELMSLGW